MKPPVTASMLYDLVACSHRVTMDLFGDATERDAPNPFVELLWEKGSLYEQQVIATLKVPFLDLSTYAGNEKEHLTLAAMERGEPLIYSGRIQADGLLGEPDLLRKESTGYIAGDIKSGSGEEGPEDNSKPKIHYAVQLGLYTDILERKGLSSGRRAFVWDIHGAEVPYDFHEPYGKRNPRTLWQDYQDALHEAQAIIDRQQETLPAYSGVCKLCHWYTACTKRLKESDDLTMIPELGRSKRDVMIGTLPTATELAGANPAAFITGKKTAFAGIGPDTLQKFHERAKLLTTKDAKPYLRAPVTLPGHDRELFFDIEVDPMRDVCYLHGFVERQGRDATTEKFFYTFAEEPTPEAEKKAFADAWTYVKSKRPCAIYYYSKYERTLYRKLQGKYPDVCTAEEIEEMFDPAHAVDLYNDVVTKATEWPTWDHSIKTLAKFLGFNWRDTHPSGAASIEWFDRWVKTGDPQVRQRILDYNEDDCIATRVLLDGIRQMAS
ncbi:TM0106 family RecB-like putative nuclease [Vineibacter terrae]|uniref:TM0106 family RecB-like putative nuclease n=1 Tax=Vineibacter terrae TaxID=2586908 RepID=A0A5C8PMX3_9HYPH|nr:TM0106 family RecB-like putative nuclease [Vineibacter terrae]TXL75126.1 TM0106 family RecB-like putative nuclease [Vineibacter terrae]